MWMCVYQRTIYEVKDSDGKVYATFDNDDHAEGLASLLNLTNGPLTVKSLTHNASRTGTLGEAITECWKVVGKHCAAKNNECGPCTSDQCAGALQCLHAIERLIGEEP